MENGLESTHLYEIFCELDIFLVAGISLKFIDE